MPDARFLQIHSLHGYPAALLNRDESGLAKRMTYGGSIRTRISSQCLKRHWRTAEGPHALHGIKGATAAVRSRDIVTRRIIEPLVSSGHDPAVIEALEPSFQKLVYGDKGTTRGSRQPLLLGEPEIEYLAAEATRLAGESGNDAKAAEKAVAKWVKSERANLRALGNATRLPAGLTAALFGRMVTSDPEANLDAAVHVAHAFTVHEEESESDYFSVVDDLKRDDEDAGAAHINETELTAGLFYGYVVLDRGCFFETWAETQTWQGPSRNGWSTSSRPSHPERSSGRPHPTATQAGCSWRQASGNPGAWPKRSAKSAGPRPRKPRRRSAGTWRASTGCTERKSQDVWQA